MSRAISDSSSRSILPVSKQVELAAIPFAAGDFRLAVHPSPLVSGSIVISTTRQPVDQGRFAGPFGKPTTAHGRTQHPSASLTL
ncbi:MAG: hypothetical protein H6532_03025 [Thermoleophilales bacterium]|nr:hypothetical protein [Thermoleophilales bacterium]